MNFPEAKSYILNRLEKELPENLYYHGLHHTLDVCNAVEELADYEKITGNDLIMLRTAAFFHDSGFIEQYLDNEPIAVEIAKKSLPAFGYTRHDIETIGKIILSTRIPQRPQNRIEQIMCDADLDYLGRDDFFEISNSLMKEWMAYGLVVSVEEFNSKQIKFFMNHSYFTSVAKDRRERKKQLHLEELKKICNNGLPGKEGF
jgi:uncharacterized protein